MHRALEGSAMLTSERGCVVIAFDRISIGEGGFGCACCSPPVPESYAPVDAVRRSVVLAREVAGEASFNCLLDGVEPFRHPALPEVLASCAEAGAERIAMVTDAGALGIRENATGALSAGLRQIHVPLLGAGARAHDPLTRPGAFDKTSSGVAGFLRVAEGMGVPALVIGLLPLCEHTVHSAPAIVATFARFGAVAVRIAVADARLVDAPELAAAFETGMINGVWVWVDGLEASGVSRIIEARAPMHIAEGRR